MSQVILERIKMLGRLIMMREMLTSPPVLHVMTFFGIWHLAFGCWLLVQWHCIKVNYCQFSGFLKGMNKRNGETEGDNRFRISCSELEQLIGII
jgi:hypothetical protein